MLDLELRPGVGVGSFELGAQSAHPRVCPH